MTSSINCFISKFNLFYSSCPPFWFVRAQQSFVCQPVSRDSGAGAGWLTIEKWFFLLIDCAVRHDLPAVFLIPRLHRCKTNYLTVFLTVPALLPVFCGQLCLLVCWNGSLILIYRHRVKSVCKSLNSHGELSLC